MPVMAHYVDRRVGKLVDAEEIDKLLFWYLQAAMWGRFSGSTESYIDQDLKVLERVEGGLDRLIDQLRLWHGGLQIDPGHFGGWSLGARFYPVLYFLTRVYGARDWWCGADELRKHLLGKMSQLELHHVFPKGVLYKHHYRRPEVNAVANFCFLTKESNLWISNRRPEEYFPQVMAKYPGALESQWIPMDPQLWRVENYAGFLEARRRLLAEAANRFLSELLHGEILPQPEVSSPVGATIERGEDATVPGGIESLDEEEILRELNRWIGKQGLPEGELLFELADPSSGEPAALLDLAWPEGLQEGYSQRALLYCSTRALIHWRLLMPMVTATSRTSTPSAGTLRKRFSHAMAKTVELVAG
jgi:hypothetical protein